MKAFERRTNPIDLLKVRTKVNLLRPEKKVNLLRDTASKPANATREDDFWRPCPVPPRARFKTIIALVGHVSKAMLARYSHIRVGAK